MLLARSGAGDIDTAALAFRVESVVRGSLQRWNGAQWVNFVVRNGTPAAQRLIGPGQRIRWVPPPRAVGTIAAFTIRAWDGRIASAVQSRVTVSVT
jgi:hypothetical protein